MLIMKREIGLGFNIVKKIKNTFNIYKYEGVEICRI